MNDDVSVILTVWKRKNLKEQLKRIYAQTVEIADVYVYQNESHFDISKLKRKFKFKHVHSKDVNFKFHGRFTLPLLLDTKYTAIFDDDTMPNPKWIEHGIEWSKKENAIVGANGRNFKTEEPAGLCDGVHNDELIEVDIVGHCWIFRTEWIHNMWREKASTYLTGEDIHFCAASKIHSNIKSIVPPQPENDPIVWGDAKPDLGSDEHATWRRSFHTPERIAAYEYWVSKGWTVK